MSLEEDDWLNLQSDVVEIILSKIPLFYHPIFASVCKTWNAYCKHKLYPVDQTIPLLVHVNNWKSGYIYYYSPFWNITFKVKSPIASQNSHVSHFFSSKDGWLVLYQKVLDEREVVRVVLINPATGASYSCSRLLLDRFFTGITFSGCPGTKDFVLFGITSHKNGSVTVCLWRKGKWKLSSVIFYNQSPFIMSPFSSPVEFKDCFCCVSENGMLGVFMLDDEDWVILSEYKKFSSPNEELHLVESKDKITLVVGGNHDPRRSRVFYLDYKKGIWRQVENLNSCSMFIGPRASIMVNFNNKKEGDFNATGIKKNLEGKGKKEVDCDVNIDVKKCKEVNYHTKSKGIKEEVHKKAETHENMVDYRIKVDVNGNLMNNRIYTTGIHRNVEVIEAEMKISDRELFFVAKACDQTRNRNMSRKSNILSYSLENHKIMGKSHGISHPLFCAWYRPDISCSLQGQNMKKS